MPDKVDIEYVCKLLDLTRPEANKLVRAKVLPKNRDGFEIAPCIHGYIRYLRGQDNVRRTAKTQTEVAKAVGRDKRIITRLVTDHGYGKGDDGLYDIAQAERLLEMRKENFLAKTKSGTVSGEPEEVTGSLRQQEIRLKTAKADLEELKRDKERGRLIDINDAAQEVMGRELVFKKAFMILPRTLSPRLVGQGVEKINALLTEFITNAFNRMCKH